MRCRRHHVVIFVLLASALVLAGCGGGARVGGSGANDDGGHFTVQLGLLPLTVVAPIYIGVEKGFFEQENLTVEPQLAQGGAAIVPATVSGDLHVGYSNNVSLLLATAKGLDLQIVSEASHIGEPPDAIVTKKGSPIDTVQELEGKTIGINTLQNVGEILTKAVLEKNGVDISTIELVEVPFPEMIPAVEEERIDAGWVVEPFLQSAREADMQSLVSPYSVTQGGSGGTYFTSDRFAEENPEVLERFTRALHRSIDYSGEHPDEVREISSEYTEIPPEVAQRMILPDFTTQLGIETIRLVNELIVEYGLVEDEPDVDELVPEKLR